MGTIMTVNNIDEKEYTTVHQMLKKAKINELEIEVVYTFARVIMQGEKDLTKAASNALSQWDC
jgi:hypothetical protein